MSEITRDSTPPASVPPTVLALPFDLPPRDSEPSMASRESRSSGHVDAIPTVTATRQFAALFLLPVKRDAEALPALTARLAEINRETTAAMQLDSVAVSISLPFSELESVHYARLVLIESHGDLGPHLAFATDYDGPEGDPSVRESKAHAHHLAELTGNPRVLDGLDSVLRHCVDYPGKARLGAYLDGHRVRSRTFYVGAPGRSVKQIRWEARLRARVEALLAEDAQTPRVAEAARRRVQARLRREGWTIPTFPAQSDRVQRLLDRLPSSAAMWSVALLALIGLVYVDWRIALAVGAIYLRFRWLEKTDPQFQPALDTDTHRRFEVASADENLFLQNQLTHLVTIKPGPLRWALIRVVFFGLQWLATHLYNKGKLGDIPSIHFARWSLIPRRGVLFFSNFDNSWQSYLGDFIDKASSGLTGATPWAIRAPPTC
jgi:hypothetical protein